MMIPTTPLRATPPRGDQIEISVLGPGYGEAIILHLGDNHWVTIDSCRAGERESVALTYLNSMGITPNGAIKLIIISHWHDDHVRGVSSLVNNCAEADVVISDALTNKEFLKALEAYKYLTSYRPSGGEEIRKVFEILSARNQPPRLAAVDSLLYQIVSNGVDVKIFSLSPSSSDNWRARLAFQNLLPNSNTVISSPEPNDAAVAIWVEIGSARILLGADLEEPNNAMALKCGWSGILSCARSPSGKASFFKIPHHGSPNAYCANVWTQLLDTNPYAVVTPKRPQRPQPNDIEKISGHTNRGYITANPKGQLIKKSQTVLKTLPKGIKSLGSKISAPGHVRVRASFTDIANPNKWNVDLFGGAYHI